MKHIVEACVAFAVVLGITFCSPQRAQSRKFPICGLVMRHLTGDKYGPAFNLARNWLSLPHISAGVGAVVVQSRKGRALGGSPGGHVSMVLSMIGPCHAMVRDDRGVYSRDICRNLLAYVQP